MRGEGHREKIGAFVSDKKEGLFRQLWVAPVVVVHVTDGHAHHLHAVEVVNVHVEALLADFLGHKNKPFGRDPHRAGLGVVSKVTDGCLWGCQGGQQIFEQRQVEPWC